MSSDPSTSPPVPAAEAAGPPADGARILFFSGGSALNPVARTLKRRTRNSIHLVPPFDSGGSSGSLRRRFAMPAVGDLRARMLALCDEDDPLALAMCRLLEHRFDEAGPALPLGSTLLPALDAMLAAAPALAGQACAAELRALLAGLAAEDGLDLRGASLGNLALTAAYLAQDRDLGRAGETVGRWLRLCGTVRCTVEADLHLSARLADGRVLCGQRQITGKELAPVRSVIEDTWLARPQQPERPVACRIDEDVAALIRSADLLVYAPGSFHSSLLVHFLPDGVRAAIAASPAPKVYMPNLGPDPELYGRSPAEALQLLLRRLGPPPLISHLLVDRDQREAFAELPAGLKLIAEDLRLGGGSTHAPQPVSRILLDLAAGGSP